VRTARFDTPIADNLPGSSPFLTPLHRDSLESGRRNHCAVRDYTAGTSHNQLQRPQECHDILLFTPRFQHRYAASQRTLTYVDHRIFQMVRRWCRRRHRNKSRKWIKEKSFQRDGFRHWIFTGTLRDQKGQGWPIQLMAAAKVRIIRYVKIRSDVNPYDPEWEPYLEERMGWQLAQTLAGRGRIEYLWKEQEGRCVACGQPLRIAEEDCQIHHRIWRSRGGQDTADNLELLHANCHRQIHVREARTKATASRKGR
jgi:RNA-directed DNA polymerase